MTHDALINALKALGHPSRLRIVEALRSGERNVGELEDATGITQPGLSQQLAVMRAADLVETRRAAKLVFYRLNSATLMGIAGFVSEAAGAREAEVAPRKHAAGAASFARLA